MMSPSSYFPRYDFEERRDEGKSNNNSLPDEGKSKMKTTATATATTRHYTTRLLPSGCLLIQMSVTGPELVVRIR